MRELTDWLDRQARRRSRSVYLEDALLGRRVWRYTWYRLRFFFARYVLASAIHVVRVVLLFEFFSLRNFVAVLLFQAAAGVIGSFWWGSLEVMRARVRELSRSGRPHLIPKEVGGWLSFAIRLGIAVGLAGIGWAVWRVGTGSFGPADLYVVSVFLRLAVELATRCYHSGIYAVRRIYRPMPTILAVEVVSFVAILGSWPFIGAWSIPASAIASTLAGAFLLIRYTGRTYRYLDLSPREHVRLRRVRWPVRGDLADWSWAGLSYAVMRLDALLVLTLFGVAVGTNGPVRLAVLFFVFSPTVRAGFEWAQLFYFDMKKLEVRTLTSLRERFDRHVLRVALVMGVLFWMVASAAGTAFYRGSLGDLYVLLLPMFVFRSLLAATQIRAFADRSYGRLVVSGAVVLTGFVATGLGFGGERARVLSAAVAMASGAAMLLAATRGSRPRGDDRGVLPLPEWVDSLREIARPVRVFAVQLGVGPEWQADDDLRRWIAENRWRHEQLARGIARRLRGGGRVGRVSPSRLVWFEEGSGSPRVSRRWVFGFGGGRIEWLRQTRATTASSALAEASREGFLGSRAPSRRRPRARRSVADVREAFHRRVPDGMSYVPGQDPGPELRALDAESRRAILHDAIAFARDLRPRRRSAFDVTSYSEQGELRLIFVAPDSVDPEERHRWRNVVKRMNLDAALRGEDGSPLEPAPGGRPPTP